MFKKSKSFNSIRFVIVTFICTILFVLSTFSFIDRISSLSLNNIVTWSTAFHILCLLLLGVCLFVRYNKHIVTVLRNSSKTENAPVKIDFPFQEGSWMAFNSPWSKIPSHGTIQLGQEYAIDLAIQEYASKPTGMARVASFPSYGKAIQAPCSGIIVKTSNWMFESPIFTGALFYLFFPLQLIRGFFPLPFIVGNYCTIYNEEENYYLTIAHIKRNTFHKKRGKRVVIGEVIAQCGNTGNSTEPHIHLQCHTKKYLRVSQGIPFEFLHDGTIYTPKNFEAIGKEKIQIE